MSNVILTATPTISSGAIYAAGDNVGGLITFAAPQLYGNTGHLIRAVTLTDRGKQSLLTDIVFFGDNPSGSTFTDNVAQTIVDADLVKIIGSIKIASADYLAYVDNSHATVTTTGIPAQCVGTSLYCVMIARGTPTYTSTTDLTLRVLLATD